MKRRIKQTAWGNWYGYEGTRKVIEFSACVEERFDSADPEKKAKQWLLEGCPTCGGTGIVPPSGQTAETFEYGGPCPDCQ